MNVFEFVVVIVLIGTVGKIIQAHYAARGARPARDDSVEVTQARDEVRQLKERIQVLERVITDKHGSDDLDRQIERLRDR
ncbi:hypothetical protein [Sphingomonas bacterium]|uniref:hypothetical protein n=1 Tax=Sphingomonas bacterium TaxID=1895847 RepID=UPI0015751E31|nr:hypothetical protein [Sphingomonas bacterium]